jgi:hypothetical protein
MAGKIKDNERKLQKKVITPTASTDTPIGKQKKGFCPKNYTPYEFEGSNKHREQVTNVLKEAGFTRRMVETKVADILLRNVSETKELKANPSTSNFDLIIVAVVEAAQRNADTSRLDNLLEKIFGKKKIVNRLDGVTYS